ncbi:hypothetical protein [Vibrio marisflavi]|uniref:Uncharacterized protein n=1 Tax=Vibrio marisflavi CECT 7928 TaxID=634439 RepID=A0ABN8E916_9VIBR|nr:hypothetical protein [Vibrio marisflavi]CAH0543138.1 hypothetical protein VMF7928_04419 [Vibrio marisflavi CECT 7928]
MNLNEMSYVELNPDFINSGFRTQAKNITLTLPANMRKVACMMQSISQHILKYGATCFASSHRLLSIYNKHASNFGVKLIKERTLYNILNHVQSLKLISRTTRGNQATGQTLRDVTIQVSELKNVFSGVYNYALSCAKKRINRQNLQSGRSSVNKCSNPSNNKGQEAETDQKICSRRSNDLSRERKNITNKGIPSFSFYKKFFKQDAETVQSLQQAARNGNISGSGAKLLIGLHNKWGYELKKSFRKYLGYVIKTDAETKPDVLEPSWTNMAWLEARIAEEEQEDALGDAVIAGEAEYYRDHMGRIQVRYVTP